MNGSPLAIYEERTGESQESDLKLYINRKGSSIRCFSLFPERNTGIEPASSAWEADALPMC